MTLEEKGTNKIEVIWIFSEEEIAKIKSHEEAGEECELLKRFANGTWELSFYSRDEERPFPAVYLEAIPQTQDYREASSTTSWCRKGPVKYKVELLPNRVRGKSHLKTSLVEFVFNSTVPNQGEIIHNSIGTILAEPQIAGSLAIHAVIESAPIAPSPPTSALFRIHGIEDEAPWPIFACKEMLVSTSSHFATLFASGFSESTSQKPIDIDKIEHIKLNLYPAPYKAVEYEYLPFRTLDQALSSPKKYKPEPEESNGEETETPLEERAQKRRKRDMESKVKDSSREGKLMTVIDAHETTYVAFRAMLAYLHTGLVPFSALPSDFLVAHDQARVAEETEDDVNDVEEVFADWLADDFRMKRQQRDWEDVDCCTPGSIYRLADRYEMDELREMSLGFILRSLTIENVAYELFSPLSLDYEVIQKPILEFFIKNWTEVKKTTGFKTVLDKFSLGELAKGRDLMETIFGLIGA